MMCPHKQILLRLEEENVVSYSVSRFIPRFAFHNIMAFIRGIDLEAYDSDILENLEPVINYNDSRFLSFPMDNVP